MWDVFRNIADFDHDNTITQEEFLTGFIVHALRLPCSTTHGLAGGTPNVFEQLKNATEGLNRGLRAQIRQLAWAMQAKGAAGWGALCQVPC